jgi:hypothetical protein
MFHAISLKTYRHNFKSSRKVHQRKKGNINGDFMLLRSFDSSLVAERTKKLVIKKKK